MSETPFKVCPMCSEKWNRVEALLADPAIELKGYQVNFDALEEGLFYFLHHRTGCETTLGIPIKAFKGLSDLPFLAPSLESRPENCTGLCLNEHELGECPEKCNCNWVRDVMQTIRIWKKDPA